MAASDVRSEEIGRVLGGRYRILALIGRGASAQVFLADDVRLRRRVAVKMLHAALADDAAFLRRFRAEAQAAAALNHPHVMAVYDWGQEADAPYLVLEYLGGGSLRALLDAGHRLSPAQALEVGLEASRALDYAHRRGLVHRDVKPANLLFGDDGRLRIADFGLARALAEAAWTEPQGAVLGTARYASPEQAQGEALTGRGDVYSLALVLVEAVTGRVPFAADTTIGTLMARVDRPLVVPAELGPLRSALERAGCPDVEERLDANGLGTALMAAADQLDQPEPLPLVGTAGSGGIDSDGDPTELGLVGRAGGQWSDDDLDVPAFMIAGGGGAGTVAGSKDTAPPAPPERSDDNGGETSGDIAGGAPATVVVDRAHGPGPASDAGRPVGVEPDETGRNAAPFRPDRRLWQRRSWPLVAAVVVVLLLGAGAIGFALVSDPEPTPAPTVPEVVGLPVAAAERNLSALGWTVETTTQRRDGSERGEVLSVRPREGAELAEGEEVVLVVSAGQTMRPVPVDQLRGKPVDIAADILAYAGLEQGEVVRRVHEDVPDGSVIDVAPGTAAELERGSAVGLVVSQGPEPRVVPDGLADLPVEEATGRLRAMGLEVTSVEDFSDTVPQGRVIGTDPAAGTEVARGASVTLRVSGGARPITVPAELAGLPADEASGRLGELGLQVGVVDVDSETVPQGRVIGVEPAAGSEVAPGSTVTLRVSRGPASVPVPAPAPAALVPVPAGLTGLPADEAADRLGAAGLLVDTKGNWSDTVPKGSVIETEPGPGFQAEPGAVVILDVSLGPRPVPVPDVSAATTLADAIAIIRGAGLEPGLLVGDADGDPVATDPSAGTEVPKGTAVDIIVL